MDSHVSDFKNIQDRLAKLEKQNRRFKQLGAAALVLVASLVAMGQAPSRKTVEANEFILRDSSGNIRARLSIDERTALAPAQFALFGTDGGQKVTLNSGLAKIDGGSLRLTDDQGKDRVWLSSSDSLGGRLSLLGEKGETLLSGGQAETNAFILRDDGGKMRATLFVTSKDTTGITLPGSASTVPATLNPRPTLALFDEKEQVRAYLDDGEIAFSNSRGHLGESLGNGSLVVLGDGDSGAVLAPGIVSVSDEQGFSAVLGVQSLQTPRTGETQKTSAASLVLFDKEKHVIWKAP
jgi:hypothetical protein